MRQVGSNLPRLNCVCESEALSFIAKHDGLVRQDYINLNAHYVMSCHVTVVDLVTDQPIPDRSADGSDRSHGTCVLQLLPRQRIWRNGPQVVTASSTAGDRDTPGRRLAGGTRRRSCRSLQALHR